MLPLGVIRDHTPVERLAWRTGLYRVGVDAAIFLGPLAVRLLGAGGEPIFLRLVGVAAPALGGRLLLRQAGSATERSSEGGVSPPPSVYPLKPIFLCEPSQNGLLAEAPQRQR